MNTFKDQGFYIEHTGGGCTAWVKKLSTGQYVVLTSASGCSHNIESDMLVGIYDGSEDEMWGNVIDHFEVNLTTEGV